MFQKLKQYKDLRDQSKSLQSVLSQETVHVDTMGGKMAMVMDGNQDILSIDIDDSLMTPENKEKVVKGMKELIAAAKKKIQYMMIQKMRKGELQLPDMSKLS
ncbi:MAG: YbaB/EbfC family nucleoid-associated protein [Candidatus Kerfeldbacteria bacterium]|nr:YbaB/EbfC family nucleoid-associated protein [Candidatus Kerfeldbacteria bacterium]